MRRMLLLVAIMAIAPPVEAGFRVTGTPTGSFCTNWILFETCSDKQIDATGKGDRLFAFPERFDSVDEERNGYCNIRIRNGVVNFVLDDVPSFYRFVGGPVGVISSYERLGVPAYVRFDCEPE